MVIKQDTGVAENTFSSTLNTEYQKLEETEYQPSPNIDILRENKDNNGLYTNKNNYNKNDGNKAYIENIRLKQSKYFGDKTIGKKYSYIYLINQIFGSGIVSIPYIFKHSGWLPCLVINIIICLLTIFNTLLLLRSMTMIPNNIHFNKRYEYISTMCYFLGKNNIFFMFMQICYYGSILVSNIISIVIVSHAVDYILVNIFGYTVGVIIYPEFQISTITDINKLYYSDNYVLCITIGYVINAIISIYFSQSNLEDNMKVQLLSFVFLMVTIFQIIFLSVIKIYKYNNVHTGLSNDTMGKYSDIKYPTVFGDFNFKQLLSSYIASYSAITVIPCWANEMKPDVKIIKTVWISNFFCCFIYYIFGYVLYTAYPHINNENILYGILKNPSVNTSMKVSIYLFDLLTIAPGIYVYCIATRYNLVNSNICSEKVAFLFGTVFPFLISWWFTSRAIFESIFTWSSLIFSYACNYITPSIIYLIACKNIPYSQKNPLHYIHVLYDPNEYKQKNFALYDMFSAKKQSKEKEDISSNRNPAILSEKNDNQNGDPNPLKIEDDNHISSQNKIFNNATKNSGNKTHKNLHFEKNEDIFDTERICQSKGDKKKEIESKTIINDGANNASSNKNGKPKIHFKSLNQINNVEEDDSDDYYDKIKPAEGKDISFLEGEGKEYQQQLNEDNNNNVSSLKDNYKILENNAETTYGDFQNGYMELKDTCEESENESEKLKSPEKIRNSYKDNNTYYRKKSDKDLKKKNKVNISHEYCKKSENKISKFELRKYNSLFNIKGNNINKNNSKKTNQHQIHNIRKPRKHKTVIGFEKKRNKTPIKNNDDNNNYYDDSNISENEMLNNKNIADLSKDIYNDAKIIKKNYERNKYLIKYSDIFDSFLNLKFILENGTQRNSVYSDYNLDVTEKNGSSKNYDINNLINSYNTNNKSYSSSCKPVLTSEQRPNIFDKDIQRNDHSGHEEEHKISDKNLETEKKTDTTDTLCKNQINDIACSIDANKDEEKELSKKRESEGISKLDMHTNTDTCKNILINDSLSDKDQIKKFLEDIEKQKSNDEYKRTIKNIKDEFCMFINEINNKKKLTWAFDGNKTNTNLSINKKNINVSNAYNYLYSNDTENYFYKKSESETYSYKINLDKNKEYLDNVINKQRSVSYLNNDSYHSILLRYQTNDNLSNKSMKTQSSNNYKKFQSLSLSIGQNRLNNFDPQSAEENKNESPNIYITSQINDPIKENVDDSTNIEPQILITEDCNKDKKCQVNNNILTDQEKPKKLTNDLQLNKDKDAIMYFLNSYNKKNKIYKDINTLYVPDNVYHVIPKINRSTEQNIFDDSINNIFNYYKYNFLLSFSEHNDYNNISKSGSIKYPHISNKYFSQNGVNIEHTSLKEICIKDTEKEDPLYSIPQNEKNIYLNKFPNNEKREPLLNCYKKEKEDISLPKINLICSEKPLFGYEDAYQIDDYVNGNINENIIHVYPIRYLRIKHVKTTEVLLFIAILLLVISILYNFIA
ncbi:amino acid transporter, putative [Plasmodium chabaudi chabaudi]|uniref:Amino acid transporter, putative n=1 Tax=Plasmodium chabaudi chabaudi TaxID=31271 RepID=A0A1D3RSE9_PLACU|nr:amino acid transporter, putative [Plasmodium chabaudi chabaudi]